MRFWLVHLSIDPFCRGTFFVCFCFFICSWFIHSHAHNGQLLYCRFHSMWTVDSPSPSVQTETSNCGQGTQTSKPRWRCIQLSSTLYYGCTHEKKKDRHQKLIFQHSDFSFLFIQIVIVFFFVCFILFVCFLKILFLVLRTLLALRMVSALL